MASIRNSSSELYECDYYAWIQDQVQALRERRIENVDWDNVAEEIEDLGRSEKRALRSQLARLIEHLLKIDHAPARVRSENLRGWQVSVRYARRAAVELLDENPSLRSELKQIFARAYLDGRDEALGSLKLPDSAIPETPPWSVEEVIRSDFQTRRRAKTVAGKRHIAR
jgi:DNA-directed RNA polymerase subunit F